MEEEFVFRYFYHTFIDNSQPDNKSRLTLIGYWRLWRSFYVSVLMVFFFFFLEHKQLYRMTSKHHNLKSP